MEKWFARNFIVRPSRPKSGRGGGDKSSGGLSIVIIPDPGGVDGIDVIWGGGGRPIALPDDEPDELVLVLIIFVPFINSLPCIEDETGGWPIGGRNIGDRIFD